MQVWSKHPPTGAHKLPTRSSSPQSADTSSQDPLEGLAADQVQPCLLLLHAIFCIDCRILHDHLQDQ